MSFSNDRLCSSLWTYLKLDVNHPSPLLSILQRFLRLFFLWRSHARNGNKFSLKVIRSLRITPGFHLQRGVGPCCDTFLGPRLAAGGRRTVGKCNFVSKILHTHPVYSTAKSCQ